jgi:hypothetical protein
LVRALRLRADTDFPTESIAPPESIASILSKSNFIAETRDSNLSDSRFVITVSPVAPVRTLFAVSVKDCAIVHIERLAVDLAAADSPPHCLKFSIGLHKLQLL